MCENLLFSPADFDTLNTFICGVCDTALHFRRYGPVTRCSICHQACGTIQLVCDTCELCICCNESSNRWKPSCYNSYFDSVESLREQFFNRQVLVSQFSADEQQQWLQCMWHDIIQNMNRFRAELLHASRIAAFSDSNVKMIIENLGLETTKGLVRLFVIFESKFDTDFVQWFSSLIQYERGSLGSAAIEASASLKNRYDQVKWLILELDLNTSNCELSGAFTIAAKMGRLEILEYLLEDSEVDPSALDNCAIREASIHGHLAIVNRLLQDDRVDPSVYDNIAIRKACKGGYSSVVERLLQDDRVDPAACFNTAIVWASFSGHCDVVEQLLQDDRVDPAARDNFAIRIACKEGHTKVVERLLQDDRVDPSVDDNSAIVWAGEYGHLNVVERLLQDDRINPAAQNNYAIQFASIFGHRKVVERLLQDDRVDPSACNNRAIRYASRNGDVYVVELLIQDGRVDPSADDNDAIRKASKNGHMNVVEMLLQDVRVDPEANDYEALKLAGNVRILECLYNRTRRTVCYKVDEEDLMKKLAPLHNQSLIVGGLCLNHARTNDNTRTSALPQDVIIVILLKWASLVGVED